jgi:TonB family protein
MTLRRLHKLATAFSAALLICSAVEAPALPQASSRVKPPRKISDVKPIYPPASLARGDEGAVIIEFTVNSSGHVKDARVVWSKCAALNDAAVTSVRQWRFEVVQLDANRVPFQGTAEILFRLPKEFKDRVGRPGSCTWIDPPKPLHVS